MLISSTHAPVEEESGYIRKAKAIVKMKIFSNLREHITGHNVIDSRCINSMRISDMTNLAVYRGPPNIPGNFFHAHHLEIEKLDHDLDTRGTPEGGTNARTELARLGRYKITFCFIAVDCSLSD